jgi:hypothetical protein
MVRWAILLLALAAVAEAGDIPEAPAVQFRDLAWWAPSACGTYGWWPGKDGAVYAESLGRIERASIIGPQELVWEHRFYPIESVMILDDQTVLVGFARGTLAMRQISGRRWEVAFTQAGSLRPLGVFRTMSRDERVTGSQWSLPAPTPPHPRLWPGAESAPGR